MTERTSLTGRGANFVSVRMPWLMNAYSRFQAKQFERTNGRRGAKLRGKPIFRLTVVGRKSGEPRSVMLMLVRRAEAWRLLTAAYPDFATYQALTERVLPIAVLTRRTA